MDRAILKLAGIDYDAGVARVMGESGLYENLLTKFLDDTNFQELKAALEEQNIKQAFNKAHTLKGITGNLSLVLLHDCVVPLVDNLRCGNLAEAINSFQTVQVQYDTVVKALKSM